MSSTRYPYLHVDVPPTEGDLASAVMWELGARGLEERDAHTLQGAEGAPDGLTLVASFETEADARQALEALDGRWPARLRFVIGDEWRDAWRRYFKPTRIGRRLVVRPSWESFDAAPDDVVLVLDPGCAFGTGTHASTRLVMAAVEAHLETTRVDRLLDVGCGSGILSIAALRLGVGHAQATDIDPDAVRVAQENAERNGVGAALQASDLPIEAIEGTFPLVLANIEARVLIPMATALLARVAPGGVLVLSGILSEQAESVREAYGELRCLDRPQEGDWTCLVLQRADASASTEG